MTFGTKKTRMAWLVDSEKNSKTRLFILAKCTNETDIQTDRHTPHDGIGRACIASRGENATATARTTM